MVVLQVKNGDHDGFLYETTCATLNDDLVRDLVRVWNTRIRLAQLCGGLMELADHGPMKHPNKAGIDEIQEKYNEETIEKGEFYKPDPSGVRNGNGVGPHLMETFERVVRDIQSVLDKVMNVCFGVEFSPFLRIFEHALSYRTTLRERYRLAWPFYKKSLIWLEELSRWVCW